MEKLFEATIKNAETNEILIKISSYSQEGLEEEMGKTKWTNFIKNESQKDENEKEKIKSQMFLL